MATKVDPIDFTFFLTGLITKANKAFPVRHNPEVQIPGRHSIEESITRFLETHDTYDYSDVDFQVFWDGETWRAIVEFIVDVGQSVTKYEEWQDYFADWGPAPTDGICGNCQSPFYEDHVYWNDGTIECEMA